jgi:hypothetical protein
VRQVVSGIEKSCFEFPSGKGAMHCIDRPKEGPKVRTALYKKVVAHVNRKSWWHVLPIDPNAYKKRGKFLASSFGEAEFWGRPLDDPQRVTVAMPLVGDEATIEKTLFGSRASNGEMSIAQRFRLDARMKRAALARGYDSILLMAPKSFFKFNSTGEFPRSLELNILRVS